MMIILTTTQRMLFVGKWDILLTLVGRRATGGAINQNVTYHWTTSNVKTDIGIRVLTPLNTIVAIVRMFFFTAQMLVSWRHLEAL